VLDCPTKGLAAKISSFFNPVHKHFENKRVYPNKFLWGKSIPKGGMKKVDAKVPKVHLGKP